MARSIVVWGGPPYFGPANSVQEETARAFRALGHEVLYLELEGDAAPFRRAAREAPGPARGTALAPDGTVVARIPKVPLAPYAMLGPAHALNARSAVAQIERLAHVWLSPGAIMVLYGWFAGGVASAYGSLVRVYDCIDEHAAAPGIEGRPRRERRIRALEEELLDVADVTVCVSEPLAEARRGRKRRLAVLPNAVRAEAFGGNLAEPAGIADLPRPRALFVGTLGPKIDVATLVGAAREAPELSWILAGDMRGVAPGPLPRNVRALGAVSHDDVPALALHSDAGVAPLVESAWNRASSPLKYGDYMAAGLPVVTSRIPAAERVAVEADGVFTFASGAAEFAAAVRRSANAGPEVRERARAWAVEHTWKDRAREMLRLVESIERERSGGAE